MKLFGALCDTDDFEWVDYLIEEQGMKPRYVPERATFANYTNEVYEEADNWETVFQFMIGKFGDTKEPSLLSLISAIYVLGSLTYLS